MLFCFKVIGVYFLVKLKYNIRSKCSGLNIFVNFVTFFYREIKFIFCFLNLDRFCDLFCLREFRGSVFM